MPLFFTIFLLAIASADEAGANGDGEVDDTILSLLSQLVFDADELMELAEERSIRFESGMIDTRREPQIHEEDHPSVLFAKKTWSERLVDSTNSTFLLQVDAKQHSMSPLLKEIRARFGISLVHYLPHNSFIIYTSHASASSIQSMDGVVWVGHLRPEAKLSLLLTKYREIPTRSFFGVAPLGDPLIELVVTIPTVVPYRTLGECEAISKRILAFLEHQASLSGGVRARVARHDRIIFQLKTEEDLDQAAKYIANDPAVQFVERRLRHQFLNRWARGVVQHGMNATANYDTRDDLLSWSHSLNGEGQVLGLGDSGVDKRSCFFASQAVENPTVPLHPQGNSVNCHHLFGVDEAAPSVQSSDKIVSYFPFADDSDASGHGTHVAGTLVGDPHLDTDSRGTLPTFAGMAPAARLAFVDIGDANGVVTLPDDLNNGYLFHTHAAGARIHTNSWGANVPLYTSEARDMDEFMSEHRDFVVVNAAGNDGACARLKSIASPATSKNGIAVGASLGNSMSYAKTDLLPPGLQLGSSHLSERSLASFSAVGPTADGRIKPDVVAPGYFVFSANTGAGDNSCSGELGDIVTPNAGTSMAAPVIAGSMALARQYFVEGFYPTGQRNRADSFTPSGSLLKATAIHGAVKLNGTRLLSDIGVSENAQCSSSGFAKLDASPIPDFDQGWGRTQLDQVLLFGNGDKKSLFLLGRDNKSTSTFGDPVLEHGEEHVYEFCSLESRDASDIKVTMVYTDVPATLGSGIQLVNDLDLQVELDGKSFRGNGKPSFDRRNPVESVFISGSDLNVARFTVRVIVRAHAIRVGASQPYSAIISGDIREGACSTPARRDRGDPDVPTEQLGSSFRLVAGKENLREPGPRWSKASASSLHISMLALVTIIVIVVFHTL